MSEMLAKPEGSMWSDDQWKAIALAGDDILVAAAAGSGKTAVLVERIIRKILDESAGFSVDRLLVATFTKAAAAEMRGRIREALERELDLDPDNEHIRRQLALLGRASITTLHSFCMEVIRRYYQLIPLDPGFRILNEHEADLMRQDMLEELFEEKYGEAEQAPGSPFLRLADWFSGERTDDALYRLVQRLYDFSRSHSWPERWLRDTAAGFSITDTKELGQTPWVRSIMADAHLALKGAAGLLEQARQIAMQPGGPAAYVDNLEADQTLIASLLEAAETSSWESMHDTFRQVAFGKLKSVRKDDTLPELQERVKELRDHVKKTVNELKSSLFGRPAPEFLQELLIAAPLMEELASTVIDFGERYREAKASKGLVDFNDLEHYCLRILRHPDSEPGHMMPSDAAVEYRAQFDEVLLDEYQDTNSVQEDIVRLISRESPGNRFMVGDVKQSIYRFRLAEPGLFLDKYKNFAADIESELSGIRIDLARNFRSRMEVVDAVNMLFRQIMNETVAEIVYDDRAELVCGASFPVETGTDSPYTPELLLIDRHGRGEEEPLEEGEGTDGAGHEVEALEMETAQLEARAIASRIREMTGENEKPLLIYDKALKTMRPAVYGDMVILLRSAAVWSPLIMEELRQEGIPAYGEQNKGYFQAIEVEIMLSLLQVIDNPRQDIPLASVLRSPIIGLSENEMAQVRLCAQGSYYDALVAAATYSGQQQPLFEQPESARFVNGQWKIADQTSLAEVAAGFELITGSSQDSDSGSGTSTSEQVTISPELGSKLSLFMDRLQRWRQEARQGSLSELIWHIYSETGYLDWLGGLPGGRQRQGNLTALYDRAVQYERDTASRGLFRFLTFISRLRDRGGDLGTAAGTESHGNAVRLMTIHKSKGLEFPIVFVAGLSKNFNQQDLNAPFLMHKELGFGPKFVDQTLRVSYPTLPNLAIRRRSQLELLAEEMRVLYVALTRPKEKMIMVGTVKDLNKKVSAWAQVDRHHEQLLPDHLLARGRNYLDWIGPAIIRHRAAERLRDGAGLPSVSESVVVGLDQADWIVSVETAESLAKGTSNGLTREEPEESADRADKAKALRQLEPVHIESKASEDKQDTRDHMLDPEPLHHRLSWNYPYETVSQISAKTSVTEMKRLLAMQESPSLDLVEEQGLNRQSREGLQALGTGLIVCS
ncbi:ATP-dependent nuclease, subunit A [Paenibacillus sp. JCM 10914]|nr:ATP-dependent nuclease, subunit A [Paenibacillus sp. JCM 10914]